MLLGPLAMRLIVALLFFFACLRAERAIFPSPAVSLPRAMKALRQKGLRIARTRLKKS